MKSTNTKQSDESGDSTSRIHDFSRRIRKQSRCQWCNELYPMSELHEETDLGLLCDNCIMAIESRGETLNLKS